MDFFENWRIIDLTHALSPEIPSWGGSCGFCLEIKKDYDQSFRVQQIKMHAGIGTHIDAPSHRFEQGDSIADLEIVQFLRPVCVLHLTKKVDADYKISAQDIEQDEKIHGKVPRNSIYVAHTGWHRFWNNPTAYRNADCKGLMHFPSFSEAAARLLLERGITALGIDTISPDSPDTTFPVHQLVLGEGKYILENLADCSEVPSRGAFLIALPIKAQAAAEAPARVIALIPPHEHK